MNAYLSRLIKKRNPIGEKMSETKLQIKYEGEKINLSDLARSLKALDKQYILYTKDSENNLYVKKVSEGSLIFEICEKAGQTLPILPPFLQDYVFFLFYTFNKFLDLKKEYPNKKIHNQYDYSTKDHKNFKKFFSPIINISLGGIRLNINIGNKNMTNNFYSSNDARSIEKKCDEEIKKQNNLKLIRIAKKTSLVFFQTSSPLFSKSKINTTGIAKDITTKPKSIVFKDSNIEKRILGSNHNVLNHEYIVDIEILTKKSLLIETEANIGEIISAYKILHIYEIIESKHLLSLWEKHWNC